MTGSAHVAHMAMMGLLVTVVAPAVLVVALQLAPDLDRRLPGPWLILAGFAALHAAVTLVPSLEDGAPIVLLVGAVAFWTPVLGRHRRLPGPHQVPYLYVAIPLLDLSGVGLLIVGDGPGGLAMLTGMLPLAAAAVFVTWRWMADEERRTAVAQSAAHPGGLS